MFDMATECGAAINIENRQVTLIILMNYLFDVFIYLPGPNTTDNGSLPCKNGYVLSYCKGF